MPRPSSDSTGWRTTTATSASCCINFVNFRDFYGRKDKAIFQAGTLYLDQRSCDLCLTVEDAGKHAAMAGLAGTYLAYCDCYRKGTGEKMQIVAAFTGGDSDNLMVGRNGIFFDRKGRDWDATITKIVDNPISIRQAFLVAVQEAGSDDRRDGRQTRGRGGCGRGCQAGGGSQGHGQRSAAQTGGTAQIED